jgi:hypothetical protein
VLSYYHLLLLFVVVQLQLYLNYSFQCFSAQFAFQSDLISFFSVVLAVAASASIAFIITSAALAVVAQL